jgi:hypothetical protein
VRGLNNAYYEPIERYQCLLATLLVLLTRITLLEFESQLLTSLIVNLEIGNQSMHLFTKKFDLLDEENKQEYWHIDWNLIQSMISLILDCRAVRVNPMMQLERIVKEHDPPKDQDASIVAIELTNESLSQKPKTKKQKSHITNFRYFLLFHHFPFMEVLTPRSSFFEFFFFPYYLLKN